MRPITFHQPPRLTFGNGTIREALAYLQALPHRRIHLVSSPHRAHHIAELSQQLTSHGCIITTDLTTNREPTLAMFHEALTRAKAANPDCVVGIGGGSALDLAKLLAAFVRSDQRVEDTFGIGLLTGRDCALVCIPTTSGTGSEVSPNAVLLDEAALLKKAIISPHLVPDAAFIDPELTWSMPPAITAATGLDALTHCIEAYTNRNAHPLVDLYALQGIRLAARFLPRAVANGADAEAREAMSLVSLYGGLCLGPVNTAAVHALSYPLGSEFHIAHGLSNALLLPAVFRFNAEATPERHAEVASALGCPSCSSPLAAAHAAAETLEQLALACGVEMDLARHGLRRDAIPHMAAAALTVQRLLRNNPRELTQSDAEAIYTACFRS